MMTNGYHFDPARFLDTLEAAGFAVSVAPDGKDWRVVIERRTTSPEPPNPLARVRRCNNFTRQWATRQMKLAGRHRAAALVVAEIDRRAMLAREASADRLRENLQSRRLSRLVRVWLAVRLARLSLALLG